MYELESLFENTAFVVNFILQLILLIVFLRLAWNVAKISKHFIKPDTEGLLDEIDKLIFKGQKKEAIDVYLEYFYRSLYDEEMVKSVRTARFKKIIPEFEELGGTVPVAVTEYIAD